MGHGDKLGLLAEETPILIENYLAVMADWNHTKPGTDLFTKHLPRNNIGVMFHRRDNNLISSLKERSSVTLRNQVNGLCGAPDENDFLLAPCIDESLDLVPRPFVGRCCLLA